MSEQRIARVFTRWTKMTPVDPDAYIGLPPLSLYNLRYDEIHISVSFTWDIERAEFLKREWSKFGKVKIGGPAIDGSRGDFIRGKYLREGVTITSRGCPNNCPWCFVPQTEGELRELPIEPGHIIQDNNLLACSDSHINKVFEMLRTQKAIEFSGGLEAKRITHDLCRRLRRLSIRHIWISYDHARYREYVKKAIKMLRYHFDRRKVRCYVLIGWHGDSLEYAENRLRWVFDQGALPFAMRYRTSSADWKNRFIFTDRSWNLLARNWTSVKSMMGRDNAKN